MDLLNQTAMAAALAQDEKTVVLHGNCTDSFMFVRQTGENAFQSLRLDRDEAEVLFRWLGHRLAIPAKGKSHEPVPMDGSESAYLPDEADPPRVNRLAPQNPIRPGVWTLKMHGISAPPGMRTYESVTAYIKDVLRVSFHHANMADGGQIITYEGCTYVPVTLPAWIVAERLT